MSFKLLLAPAAVVLLAGCSTVNAPIGSADPGFGEAAKYNAAVQTIDPDPVYAAEDAQPGDHGEKGQKAVDRYRKDAVKQTEQIQTTGGGPG